MVTTRRKRNRNRIFENGLGQLREAKWKYDEWLEEWTRRHDAGARDQTRKLLSQMYAIVEKLARNNHHRELVVEVRKLNIPGVRRYLTRPQRARRR